MLHKKRKPSAFTSSSGVDCKYGTAENNMLHSKSTYFYRWLPISCSVAFLLGIGIALNPVIDNVDKASAATTNVLTDTTLNTKVDLIMDDVINSSTTVEPGDISAISNSFSVKVEGQADYHISVQAAEGYGSELVGRNNKEKISGVGNNVTPGNFGDNTWGYALIPVSSDTPSDPTAEQTYSTLPAYGTLTAPTYSVTDARDQTDVYYLAFAAKITDYKPADHYETQALLSVVAEAKEVVKVFINPETGQPITTMQEMTSEICGRAAIHDTLMLEDIRDGERYWVAKLADGNCWMTQNLRYNGSGSLHPPEEWDNWGSMSSSDKYYYNPGKKVYRTPLALSSTVVDVSGGEWSPYTMEEVALAASDKKVVDEDNHKYDAHYLNGNYYTRASLTAKLNNAETNSSDVCPKGWALPLAGADCKDAACSNDGGVSFRNLLDHYGFIFTTTITGSETVYKGGVSTYISSTGQNIAAEPLYFVRSGWIWSKSLSNNGESGYLWASNDSTDIGIYGYTLTLSKSGSVSPSSEQNRLTYGYSARCVASGANG